jgi:hypothetical protein
LWPNLWVGEGVWAPLAKTGLGPCKEHEHTYSWTELERPPKKPDRTRRRRASELEEAGSGGPGGVTNRDLRSTRRRSGDSGRPAHHPRLTEGCNHDEDSRCRHCREHEYALIGVCWSSKAPLHCRDRAQPGELASRFRRALRLVCTDSVQDFKFGRTFLETRSYEVRFALMCTKGNHAVPCSGASKAVELAMKQGPNAITTKTSTRAASCSLIACTHKQTVTHCERVHLATGTQPVISRTGGDECNKACVVAVMVVGSR